MERDRDRRDRDRDDDRPRERDRDRDRARDDRGRNRDGDRDRERRDDRDRDRDRDYRRDDDRDRDRDRRGRDRDRDRRFREDESVDPGRAVFVGNLAPYATLEEVRDLFDGLASVNKIDLKQGYAFVFLENGHHKAIRELDGKYVGRKTLRVELARGDGLVKKREDARRGDAARNPSETLFVVNFDSQTVRSRDLEDLFAPYGKIIRVEMKRNFAFVQFSQTSEASAAMDALNGSQYGGRTMTVEYVARGYAGDSSRKRGRSRSVTPPRRRSPTPRRQSRSPSPRRRRFEERDDNERDRRDRGAESDRRYDDRHRR